MKIIIYLISIGLFLTLQSCDRFSSLLGDDISQQEQVVDDQKQGVSGNEQVSNMTDQATTAQMQSQLQQNEDGIRQINDSLNILNSAHPTNPVGGCADANPKTCCQTIHNFPKSSTFAP